MKCKLIDKQDRSRLCEGKTTGIGFALAKKDGKTLELVGAVSPCKDYLSDQVYSEHSGKPYGAWGYRAVQTGCLKDNVFMVFGYCPSSKTGTAPKEDVEKLEANIPKILDLLNKIESELGKVALTSIDKLEDNRWVATGDLFWASTTYLISLYSLLVRAGQGYDGRPFREWLACQNNPEYMTTKCILPKLEKILKREHKPQDFTTTWGVHDAGIVGHAV